MADDELLTAIRREIAESPFVGEGHKKLRARLALRGIDTSGKRVLRLTRGAGLLAPTPKVRKRAKRLHDGTITVTVPDTLWATDATEAHTGRRAAARSSRSSITPAARSGSTPPADGPLGRRRPAQRGLHRTLRLR